MTDKEALKRIAEKLRRAGANLPAPEVTGTIEGSVVTGLCIALVLVESEIEALAQTEQEPVAWMSPSWIDPNTRGWQSDSFESIPIEGWLPLYTQPPQRTWVGLTGEDLKEIKVCGPVSYKWVKVAEAKLKEKNT
jgi:hypothetical protein